MAPTRLEKPAAVGSIAWIHGEKQLADSYVAQEKEEFAFSARNEMEWLNEHMAEVMARRDFDVAEVFKTPGKLRGKTPHTARPRNSLHDRAPLTDVFMSSTPSAASPSRTNQFFRNIVQFQVAEDTVEHEHSKITLPRLSIGPGKENTDSGYHDMTVDELVEDELQDSAGAGKEEDTIVPAPLQAQVPSTSISSPGTISSSKREPNGVPRVSSASEGPTDSALSFVSANEEVSLSNSTTEMVHDQSREDIHEDKEPDDSAIPQKAVLPSGIVARSSNHFCVSAETAATLNDALDDAEKGTSIHFTSPSKLVEPEDFPSDTSSPVRTILPKKGSLNFAALPAREPLTSKKTNDNHRLSHNEQVRSNGGLRESYLDRLGHKSGLSIPSHLDETEIEMDDAFEKDPEAYMLSSREIKAPIKSSTQRLQERITMLGKSNAPRPSKSISVATLPMHQMEGSATGTHSSQEPTAATMRQEDVDDEWIGPIKESATLKSEVPAISEAALTGVVLTKTLLVNPAPSSIASAGDIAEKHINVVPVEDAAPCPEVRVAVAAPSPMPAQRKTVMTSYPSLSKLPIGTVTPASSPTTRKNGDGPISASKAKFYSVLKSAKGIFASTAGVSAQAKFEVLTGPTKNNSGLGLTYARSNEIQAQTSPSHTRTAPFYPELPTQPQSQQDTARSISPSKPKTPNKPRRSSDRIGKQKEKSLVDVKTKQYIAEDLERIRDAERQKATVQRQVLEKTLQQPNMRPESESALITENENPSDQPPSPPPKTLPLPQGLPKGHELRRPTRLADSEAVKAQPPAPMSVRVASQRIRQQAPPSNTTLNASLQESLAPPTSDPVRPKLSKKTSSSSVLASATSQGLKTAASSQPPRPRALEAAARKKEQDEREAQRKAANKRDLERKRAAKIEEDRKQVQEQKAAEQQRLLDLKQAAQKQAAERKAEVQRKTEQQRIQAASRNRIDDPFQPSQHQSIQGGSRVTAPHVNPAKPLKRLHQIEDDNERYEANSPRVDLSALPHPPKRRRTSDLEVVEPPPRPTMAPPVRLSAMRKEGQSKFGPTYGLGIASHAAPSMLKSAVTAQHHLTHPKTPHINDTSKFSNARIPFAEQANNASAASHQQLHRAQALAKTPATAHKSSPQYPNGDSIELPEIASDSDSDDENDFKPPDWADSPALKELLAQQQLVDPMKVFGPIAPLVMEEVFKGNKERQAKFRARTSSANWNGPDRLTEDERKRDFEAREKLERDGGWTFNGAV